MRYIAIDIETAGLNSQSDSILSIGAVIEDTDKNTPVEELPTFHKYIKNDVITGSPFALNMNKEIIESLAKGDDKKITTIYIARVEFMLFLADNEIKILDPILVAGKNFTSFDKPFLDREGFLDNLNIHRRVLDPGILYFDKEIDDVIPSLDTCMQRAGIKTKVTHDAVQDCRDVIKVLRYKL